MNLWSKRIVACAVGIGMASVGPAARADDHATTRPAAAERVIRVAIYTDGGAPDRDVPGKVPSGPTNVTNCLRKLQPGRYEIKKVKGEDVRNGILDQFDVAVFPGGSGSGQAKSLEPAGRAKVREFVERGGGYLGICGGAYLGTSMYPYSLHLVNARVIDREHWNRGDPTPVKLELTPLGRQRLDTPTPEVTCIYHQGPLLGPDDKAGLPAYQTLATFGTEVTQRAPKGVMIGTTAIAQTVFGKGHVILISPHPEKSDGLDGFIRQAVDWVGQGPASVPATPPDADDPATAKPATAPAVSDAVR